MTRREKGIEIMKKSVICLLFLVLIITFSYGEYLMKWTNVYNASLYDVALGIAVDSIGNVYVTGESWNGVNFDCSTIKYSPSGTAIWTNMYDSGYRDSAHGIAIDQVGNIYITGFSRINGDDDYCTIKYNSAGTAQWTNIYDSGSIDEAYGIDVDDTENVYITGFSKSNYCTIKYDSIGTAIWTNIYDGGSMDSAHGIVIDQTGDIYVTGSSYIGGDFNYYTIKYNSGGTVIWTRSFKQGFSAAAADIAIDKSGNVYITGSFNNGSDNDYCTIKYDSSGTILWTNIYNNGNSDLAEGIAVDSAGNIYVCGNNENGFNINYCTIKYNPSGIAIWTNIYDRSNWDYASGVAVATNYYPDRVFVTGRINTYQDYFTYGLPPQRKPGNLSGTAVSSTAIEWTWTDQSDDEAGFQIQDIAHNNIGNVGQNITVWTETGLSPNTSYTRVCVATNALGNSHDSEMAVVFLDLYSGPYYVATNGNDSGNVGSFTQPFRTIQKAVDVMSPGVTSATCYIFPGVYSETVEICSNKNSGYMVFTSLTNNNPPIISGSLFSNYAFFITNTSKIIIDNFIIKKFDYHGVLIKGNSRSNIIANNLIFSNNYRGIYLNSDEAKHNCFFGNKIWGINQRCGIFIYGGDKNTIYSNHIHNNQRYGIELMNSSCSNYIVKNVIISNDLYGIIVMSSDFNYINNNNIWGKNQMYGIKISQGKRNTISSNLIHDNSWNGIHLFSTAISNNVFNNNIYYNNYGGILIEYASTGGNSIKANNIWGANQDYGLCIDGGDRNIIFSNNIHNNQNHGVFLKYSASSNFISKNFVYSNNLYGLYINSDNANDNYIINNNIYGFNQKSGVCISNGNRNIINLNNIYDNEEYGVFLNGSAGTNYINKNIIFSNNICGINIVQDTVNNNYILTNHIWGANQNYGIRINSGYGNIIELNTINNNQLVGISCSGKSSFNNIIRNTIFSNNSSGISISSDTADSNFIMYNNIWGLNQSQGISIYSGDNNIIYSNSINNNYRYGVYLYGSACSNYIIKNTIYSNDRFGIKIDSETAENNFIESNNIWGVNQNHGICINNSDHHKIYQNKIHHNQTNAIYIICSTNIDIENNYVYNNLMGLNIDKSKVSIHINSITDNNYGVFLTSGDFTRFDKNNIFDNTIWNFDQVSFIPKQIINNWWGTTIASNIIKGVNNNGGYSNFTPYRLFGSYDITPSADTDSPQNIVNISAISNMNYVDLVWSSVWTNDFHHYNIYRSDTPGTINLSKLDIIAKVFSTNYIDYPPAGTWYYYITACDNNLIYTNESWYSEQASVSNIPPSPDLDITLYSVEHFIHGSSISGPIPGCTFRYGILLTNKGGAEASGVEVISALNTNVISMVYGSMTNMKQGIYATNVFSDYIQWTKIDGNLAIGESSLFYFDVHSPDYAIMAGAGLLSTDPIYVQGSNFLSKTNIINIAYPFGKIYGGEFNEETLDKTNQYAGQTNYFTNMLINRGNTSDTFRLSITSTNSNGFTGGHWSAEIQNLAGETITNTELLINGVVWIFRLAITSQPTATNGAYYEYRIAAQSLSNTSATNYVGDNGVTYGGTIGDGADGPGYVNMNNDMIRLTIDNTYSPVLTPSVPSSLRVKDIRAFSITLKWQDIAYETGYKLYRNITDNVNTAVYIVDIPADQIEYTDENLNPRTTYYYWLKAFNGSGSSGYSSMVHAKTLSTYEKDLSKLIIGPCPFKPYDGNNNTGLIHTGITFDRLTQQATIKVYTIHGQLVAELHESDGDGKYTWQAPESIASGVYICCVTNPQGEKRVRKIMIIK